MKTFLLALVVTASVALAAVVGGLPLTAPWQRAYARRVMRHKRAVWQAGLRVGGIPWRRLLLHDLSKFGRAEFIPYAEWFCHRADETLHLLEHARQRRDFLAAMKHHLQVNDHHWEFWMGDLTRFPDHAWRPRDMPVVACREMVADWMAASYAYDGRWPTAEAWPWLAGNWHRITLSPLSRARVRAVLQEVELWQTSLDLGLEV